MWWLLRYWLITLTQWVLAGWWGGTFDPPFVWRTKTTLNFKVGIDLCNFFSIVGLVSTRNALYGVVHYTLRNTSLPFVHTARRSYRWTALWVGRNVIWFAKWGSCQVPQTVWSKGKKSRNKAPVGEPAGGSLRLNWSICILGMHNEDTRRVSLCCWNEICAEWMNELKALLQPTIPHWAMDPMAPSIEEGRSELWNVGRVNCKTPFDPFWNGGGLLNTLLTERAFTVAFIMHQFTHPRARYDSNIYIRPTDQLIDFFWRDFWCTN